MEHFSGQTSARGCGTAAPVPPMAIIGNFIKRYKMVKIGTLRSKFMYFQAFKEGIPYIFSSVLLALTSPMKNKLNYEGRNIALEN